MKPKHFPILLLTVLQPAFTFSQSNKDIISGRIEPQLSLLKENVKTADIDRTIQYFDIDEDGKETAAEQNTGKTFFRFYPSMVIDSIFHTDSRFTTRIKCGADGKIIDKYEQFTNAFSYEHHSGDTIILSTPRKTTIKTFDKEGHLLTSTSTSRHGAISNRTERKETEDGTIIEESIDYAQNGVVIGKRQNFFDKDYHLLETLIYQNADSLTERISYSYDKNWKLQQYVDDKSIEIIEETYSYDDQGRETSHFKWISNEGKSVNIQQTMSAYDSNGNITQEEYDSNNNVISSETTTPEGKRLHFIRYSPDGSVLIEEKRTTDNRGFDIVTTTETGYGHTKKTESIFNKNEDLIKKTSSTDNGETQTIFERNFNDDGTAVSTEHFSIRDGEETAITQYDKWGNVTKSVRTVTQSREKRIETTTVKLKYY